jgi:sugar/nucleoside kinase (ribokinase family)
MPLPTVVVAGHICLDIIPDMGALPQSGFQELFQPGHLIEVGAAAMSTGGPVSNTGLALHRLGIPTRLVGKVGADPFGQVLCDLMRTRDPQLASGLIVDPKVSTSYSVIVSPPGEDRVFLHCPGANHTFCAADMDLRLLNQATLFHFGYPPVMRQMYVQSGQGLLELFRRVKQNGIITSLDMCYPDPASEGGQANWPVILNSVLPYVDIFLPSIEELLLTLAKPTFIELSRRGALLPQVTPALLHELSNHLLSLGVKIVVIKLGERGLYLRTAPHFVLNESYPADPSAWADQELWAPCFKVQVVGTTGSGDATIAGFLSGMLRGFTPAEAATAAVAVGACNVEAADACSGLLSWEDTLQRVAAGWERLPLELNDPGWEWNHSRQVWINTKE